MRASKIADAVRYVYVNPADHIKGRRVTVAYTFDDESKQIVWNYAECSPKDRFAKKDGRMLAAGRLIVNQKTHPNLTVPYEAVSEMGKGPRYNLIAQELYLRACTVSM